MAEARIDEGTRSQDEHSPTPDGVTADGLGNDGTGSRETATSIGGESTAAETRASTNIATNIKTLKLTDPGKSVIQTTGMEVESDRDSNVGFNVMCRNHKSALRLRNCIVYVI